MSACQHFPGNGISIGKGHKQNYFSQSNIILYFILKYPFWQQAADLAVQWLSNATMATTLWHRFTFVSRILNSTPYTMVRIMTSIFVIILEPWLVA